MKIFFNLVALSVLTHCASISIPKAREISRVPTVGGKIALSKSYKPNDRAKAEVMMKANCGEQRVVIASESDEPNIGVRPPEDQEIRITYDCAPNLEEETTPVAVKPSLPKKN